MPIPFTASLKERLPYVISGLLERSFDRDHDSCFEHFDGAMMVAAVMREARKSAILERAIRATGATVFDDWSKIAAQFDHLTDDELEKAASEHRRVTSERSQEEARRWREDADAAKARIHA